MKKFAWQKSLSLLLSFVIVFNITMIPVFADENDAADEHAQEEQTLDEDTEEPDDTGEEGSDPEDQDEGNKKKGDKAAPPERKTDEEQEPEEQEDSEPEPHVSGEGKYVKDVYIAYAKTEEEAKEWLRKHKWEPLTGNADFNAGKASAFDGDMAAVMGIRRTDKAKEAITDMAVMNMKGGYSMPDYETLLKEKKAEINEFIDSFIPVLKEYRTNYNGEGSDAGKVRAEIAHDILNRFYDGDKDDPYAANDTEMPLGDLFLEKIRQEDGGENGGDMQQIILESSGPAVTMVEVCLALAADDGEETWLERLQELSEDEISKNLSKYVPEAKDQDIAPSAVKQFLKQHFGDSAKILASQWSDVHDDMIWYEEYNEKNDLWQKDGEEDEAYNERISKYFEPLDKKSSIGLDEEHERWIQINNLFNSLYEIPYNGEWGETLGDFFNPAEGEGYDDDTAKFLPFAAALSKGQRASLQHVNLETLLILGMSTEDVIRDLFPDVEDMFKDTETLSIYSGINRGIYRGGVALTSTALMEKNQNGYDPFADMWSFEGVYNITTYAAAAVGVITLGIGAGYFIKVTHSVDFKENATLIRLIKQKLETLNTNKVANALDIETYNRLLEKTTAKEVGMVQSARVIMGVGGALLVGAAMVKGYQLYRHYQKTFTQIPNYIVDEADIVSYEKDDEGNEAKLIDFDQFVYYDVVKCNRQEVGEISDWQDGVEEYADWGCGDAADLNGDFGQQWLALYSVKSDRKGYPVLADSLTLQYGSKDMPKGCSKALHMFTFENAADLGDTAYSYNNKKNGVYFFWDVDEKASDSGAASSFAGGTAAISGGIGFLAGMILTAIVMRKKKEQQ